MPISCYLLNHNRSNTTEPHFLKLDQVVSLESSTVNTGSVRSCLKPN